MTVMMISPFIFELGESVDIVVSGERGVVVARTEYANSDPSYLVNYKAANGCATHQWFYEDDLTLVCDEDDACAEALPTDAEIPMEQPMAMGFDPALPSDTTLEWKKIDTWTPDQTAAEAAQ